MNLDQLLKLEGITDYYILWYGAEIADQYMNDSGLLKGTVDLQKGKPKTEERIYIFLSGIDKKTCRYRFAGKLHPIDNNTIYSFKRVNIQLDDYAGRLVLRRENGFSLYNSATTGKDFIVEEIWGKELHRTVRPFIDYDSVELSFDELKEVIEGHYSDYFKALSSVKGIYMIVDGNTGKLYIGSAYGSDGIWGRWNSYVNTFHGGNFELEELYLDHGEEYFLKFKYIILQILPFKISDKEIIEIEAKYKNRFLTREFGLNSN
ncbi:MAG: GIY-YIG nuclease family protein [Oscillospiraceae bacterium]|nr:GIY-YIG nuclease family protein [Oscillospiraceae bacterium]MBR3448952.1 GIY-YIG nuclease family protein [Oscillospiraceae bacterium]MBR4200866.1 GIY-YIG nuclease family protein [Oscillospiraceae bacterium]